jgi:putative spermidine/putrescine transport system ATP-binding protein
VSGTVTEVVYLGAATHSVVDVGDVVRITVLQQNQENSVDHVLARRGERVTLSWRREHVVRLGDGEQGMGDQVSTHEETRGLR